MYQKLLDITEEHARLNERMSTQEVASNPSEFAKVAKAQSELNAVVQSFAKYQDAESRSKEAETILSDESDAELREMAEVERDETKVELDSYEQELKVLLIPKDPNDSKNTIVEIRAGTGGDEAGLFASDLFKMYERFAELKHWKIDILNSNPTGLGGFKEITFKIDGDNVYSQMKFEGGGHRVQRVPATESQGRVHTSAATVAVLPEAEAVDIEVDPSDLQIDVYRSSGPGGQSVNTTDSAVRITHKPTGVVVTCQDEKSQHKNKAKALQVLRARLLQAKQDEEAALRSDERRSQVGSGDRSERIRTYNFPQNRLTDHRINLTLHRLEQVMQGELQEVVDALVTADRASHLAAES